MTPVEVNPCPLPKRSTLREQAQQQESVVAPQRAVRAPLPVPDKPGPRKRHVPQPVDQAVAQPVDSPVAHTSDQIEPQVLFEPTVLSLAATAKPAPPVKKARTSRPQRPVRAPRTAPRGTRHMDREERAAHGASRNLPLWTALGLGAVAITVPLTAFIVPGRAAPQEKVIASFTGANDWRTQGVSAAKLPTATDLIEDNAAVSKSSLRSPLEVSSCLEGVSPANALREINQKEAYFWPLEEGTYSQSSTFSWRVSPITGQVLMHEGVDWSAASGSPIHVAAAGVVTDVGYNERSGNFVVVEHVIDGEVFTTHYYHQLDGSIKVSKGDEVVAGQAIGAVGNTGWSTGPHLHFEVRNSAENAVEPVNFLKNRGAVYLGEGCS